MIQIAPAPDTLLQAAFRFFEAADFEAAEAYCRRALAAAPANVDALTMLGIIQLTQLRYAEAEPVFEQLLQLRPDEPAYWVNLGTARRGTGRHEESLAAYARAAALGEASVEFYFQLGLTHMERADLQSAKAVLAR